eukprot:Selendium_serpulae@DN3630_c0_g1_i1.p2
MDTDSFNTPPPGGSTATLGEALTVLTTRLRTSHDRQNPLATEVIQQSYDHANMFAKFKSAPVVAEIRNKSKDWQLDQRERALLINLLPRSTEEAQILIPSLTHLAEAALNDALEYLAEKAERQ